MPAWTSSFAKLLNFQHVYNICIRSMLKVKWGELFVICSIISNCSSAPAVFGSIWVANVICNLKLWKLFMYLNCWYKLTSTITNQNLLCKFDRAHWKSFIVTKLYSQLYFMFVLWRLLMLDFEHLKLLFCCTYFLPQAPPAFSAQWMASEQFGSLQRALWLVYFKTTQQK